MDCKEENTFFFSRFIFWENGVWRVRACSIWINNPRCLFALTYVHLGSRVLTLCTSFSCLYVCSRLAAGWSETFVASQLSASREVGSLSSKGRLLGIGRCEAEAHVCSLNLASRNCYEIIPRQVLCGKEEGWNRIFPLFDTAFTTSTLWYPLC